MPHPCPGERLHDLFREVFALRDVLALGMDAVHELAGLRTPQVRTVGLLDRLGGATVPDMAAALGLSRQGVQVVCNELRDMGLVAFVDNPRHKRSKRAVLTDAGRNRLQSVRQNEARTIEALLPDVDGIAVSDALSLLRNIRAALLALAEKDPSRADLPQRIASATSPPGK
ncbi:MarR family winged helix-turn-helix transcriptional regulator [Desulfolutivibrio sulfoxidireducens]|uniref:MarR family winged helix-turn-helix transcriptional regulator n=1 Tax=Desulfolutivibrio sulfoxidireducens TaxID=2773299 RepID=UPI00159DD4DF|nr:MarR family winged helix-turn-helix transcriptional regulator [Desulfolutivibrio sulfoxidireducens]QLA17371.1 MarR family transcriptional regulator [Desulfolutivibrio sulfoxidireducens]